MNRTITLIFGLIFTLPIQAQSLADALEQAWSRNPAAAAGTVRKAEAQARIEAAASMTPGPASISLSNLNDRAGRNLGKQEWEIEMAVPLWLPGQKAAREAEAFSAQSEMAARYRALRLQIAGEVRDRWWAVAAARNASTLARHRVATARALESDVLRRFRAGELARIDANLVQNERLAADAELADAETLLLQAEHAYRSLTGVAAPAVLAAENAVATRETRDNHPQLAALAAAAQLARAKLKAATKAQRDAPELAMRVARDRSDFTEPYSNAIGVKLTIPFSFGPRVRQENSAARAEVDQADAELALAHLKLDLERESAERGLDTAERQLTMAQQRRELTADTLRLAEKAFSIGESDLPAVLRARAAAFEAEALLNRQQVTLAASRSRINQILGVLP
ncbi:MAG TPA: TolC family protein [Burkholderiaceae bacterium]|nr:TolC family protein [Burkholderiaceae bacterium]